VKKPFQLSNRYYFLIVGLGLMTAFAIMRGYGMLGPLLARPLLPLSFVLMMIIPFVLLNKRDRNKIGLQKSESHIIYLYAIVLGAVAAVLCYIIGFELFQHTHDNWYVTIKNFYTNNPAFNKSESVFQNFLIFTVPALLFSPIGEEIFFRGFFQEVLKLNLSGRVSTFIECSCFGLIHLFHHGVTNIYGHLIFHPVSAFIWVVLMSSMAFLLLQVKRQSNSLYPTMLCHASFNLGMNVVIFYWM
jgi:uncharacterized protein